MESETLTDLEQEFYIVQGNYYKKTSLDKFHI